MNIYLQQFHLSQMITSTGSFEHSFRSCAKSSLGYLHMWSYLSGTIVIRGPCTISVSYMYKGVGMEILFWLNWWKLEAPLWNSKFNPYFVQLEIQCTLNSFILQFAWTVTCVSSFHDDQAYHLQKSHARIVCWLRVISWLDYLHVCLLHVHVHQAAWTW